MISDRNVWLNGEFLGEADAHISVRDRGFLVGDGCFETLIVYGGVPWKLDEHLARLERSMELLHIRRTRTPEEIAKVVRELPAMNNLDNARVRITVSRGLDCEALPGRVGDPTILITATPQPPVPKASFTDGWRAIVCRTVEHPGGTIWTRAKSTSRIWLVIAGGEAERAQVDEALISDHRGCLIEGTRSNFFIASGGRLVTPPAESGALAGITRAEIISLAKAMGIETIESDITPDDVYAADECFISRSTAGVVPIVRLDDHPIGAGTPGPIALRLADAYEQAVRSICGPDARVRE